MPESAVPGYSAPGIPNYQWDEIFDVVVVGSGGGALTSAMVAARGGASTVVVEKDQYIGGTTAVSGGEEKGRDGNSLPQMIMGLGPGSIIVNQQGNRFMHGGYTYNDFCAPFGFPRKPSRDIGTVVNK